MDDSEIGTRIEALVAEEHALWDREESAPENLHADERDRLEQVKVTLDRCWDLLRQRRARREFGLDPTEASPRTAATVEHYEQ